MWGFADDFTTDVFEAEPYAARGERDTLNSGDGIYDESVELTLSEEGGGYLGLITLDVA